MGEPTGHPSPLVLDELAAGLEAAPEVKAHLDACPPCGAAVAERRAGGERLRQSPRYSALGDHLEALASLRPPAPPSAEVIGLRRRALWLAPVAAAAALLFVLARPSDEPRERLKGPVGVALVRADGQPAVTLRPGERVRLQLSPSGRRFGAVFAITTGGSVERLWPATGHLAGRLPAPNTTVVGDFEVTPGALTLVAIFADQALPLAPVEETLTRAVQQELSAGRSPLALTPPDSLGEARAVRRVEVKP